MKIDDAANATGSWAALRIVAIRLRLQRFEVLTAALSILSAVGYYVAGQPSVAVAQAISGSWWLADIWTALYFTGGILMLIGLAHPKGANIEVAGLILVGGALLIASLATVTAVRTAALISLTVYIPVAVCCLDRALSIWALANRTATGEL